jgi:hypothetical protein
MKTLDDVAMRLDILIELLATMHPYKPEINFSQDGRSYNIRWNKPDPAWPVHGDMKEAEHTQDESPYMSGVTMLIGPDGEEFTFGVR